MRSIAMRYKASVTIGMDPRLPGIGNLSVEGSPELEPQFQASARSSSKLNTPLTGEGSIRAVGPGSQYADVRLSRFSLTGSVSGRWVSLGRAVTFSLDPALIGIPVLITADEQTGAITLHFGEIVPEGSGTVLVR